jgi:hypothetical protein
MNERELVRLEQELLAMLSGTDLDWVLSSVREGIAAGRPEEVHVRRERQGEEVLPLDLTDEGMYSLEEPSNTDAGRRSSKGQRLVRNVPLRPAERVILIIEALRRVIVELPAIHEAALKLLMQDDQVPAGAEVTLRFLPDEDDQSTPPTRLEAISSPSARESREALARILDRLESEVRG